MEWAFFWIGVNFVIGYLIGKPKDQAVASAFLCVFLGPIGWIMALCDEGNLRRCPHCSENVKPDALICRYCRGELPTILATPPPPPKPEPSLRVTAAMFAILVLIFAAGVIWAVFYSQAPTINTKLSTTPLAVMATPTTNTTRWEAPVTALELKIKTIDGLVTIPKGTVLQIQSDAKSKPGTTLISYE